MKWRQKKTIQRKSWFFEKINRIDKPLANLSNMREKTQIHKFRNEKEELTTNTMKI
jgi:hypothetical protein